MTGAGEPWSARGVLSVGPNPEPGGRDLAVGDVHGCFALLREALDAVGFDPGRDRLFSVGDLVDRGPESAEALDWLAQPWMRAVMGNHEFLAWRSAMGRPYPHVDHGQHGGAWLGDLDPSGRARVAEEFSALPVGLEVQTAAGLVGMVHADCPFDDWGEMREARWTQSDGAMGLFDACLWSVERFERAYAAPVKGVAAVVHGHVVVPKMLTLGNCRFIDTGGWRGGKFTILDLGTLLEAKPARAAQAKRAKALRIPGSGS